MCRRLLLNKARSTNIHVKQKCPKKVTVSESSNPNPSVPKIPLELPLSESPIPNPNTPKLPLELPHSESPIPNPSNCYGFANKSIEPEISDNSDCSESDSESDIE